MVLSFDMMAPMMNATMMNATIYHKTSPLFFESISRTVNLSDYTKVATIETVSLTEGQFEFAYMRSQNIEESWLSLDGVIEKAVEQARSTSVGDIIEVNGNFMEVGTIGFSPITVVK